jgi:hypothetical protein
LVLLSNLLFCFYETKASLTQRRMLSRCFSYLRSTMVSRRVLVVHRLPTAVIRMAHGPTLFGPLRVFPSSLFLHYKCSISDYNRCQYVIRNT